MSLSARAYSQQRKKEWHLYHRLVAQCPLNEATIDWLKANGKHYRSQTLADFNVHQGVLQRFDKEAGPGSRGFVCADPCIIIQVGPIHRCYRYLRPKDERWHVVPAGYGAQWLGDLSQPDWWWFNVRASNTEPLLRLNLEASNSALMNTKRDELIAILGEPE